MLLLGHAEEGRTLVEEKRPRAGRALVEGEEIAHKGAMVQCPRLPRPVSSKVRRRPPEPDISIVRNRSYAVAHPGAVQDYLIAGGDAVLALAALSRLAGSLTLGFALRP